MTSSNTNANSQPVRRPGGAPRSGTRQRHRPYLALLGGGAILGVLLGVLLLTDLSGGEKGSTPTTEAATVGGDLHAVAVIDGRRFVSGHEGAGFSDTDRSWQRVATLDGKDGMGWAQVPGTILVGGHEGLYASTDRGVTFQEAGSSVPVRDVHALGASGRTVYLASPTGGLFVSIDAGKSFSRRSDQGVAFMGTMSVDPADPEHVLAPDMRAGVVESRDGGATWRSLGGPAGAMSVAQDPRDRARIVAVGMDGAAVSKDSGRTWASLDVPEATSAVTFDSQGRMVAAALVGDRAEVYLSESDSWRRV